jgi:hypothetical protein
VRLRGSREGQAVTLSGLATGSSLLLQLQLLLLLLAACCLLLHYLT